ncbi:MAG: multiheme c-type cytochrome [Gammaproteobacteria bacterium]
MGPVAAFATETPGARHEGVATCASTTCHGAARPLGGTPVLQNEYVTWSAFDPHASAFRTLRDERSTAIARRLGMGPADQAPACLACHAETVPAGQRGPRFQQDDGIGCEACHGAAANWLVTHDDGTPEARAASRRNGLRALDDPDVRGAVCLACHAGDGDRTATHAMMAAGHPRLAFELDTFTELWRTSGGREHYRRDADYAARKEQPGTVEVWLGGLVMASAASVAQVEAAVSGGALPEFAAFNCYSCHRSMGFARWREHGPAAGSMPGALRINDSALRLLQAALQSWDPAAAGALKAGMNNLQRAANEDRTGVAAAADGLRRELSGVSARLHRAPPGPADQEGMLRSLLRASGEGAYPDYATAEQAAMAAVVLLTGRGNASGNPDVDALFADLEDDAAFDQARFARILGRLSGRPPSGR